MSYSEFILLGVSDKFLGSLWEVSVLQRIREVYTFPISSQVQRPYIISQSEHSPLPMKHSQLFHQCHWLLLPAALHLHMPPEHRWNEMRVHFDCLVLWIDNGLTATVLAVESPRSFWQWVEIITFSIPGVFDFMSAINFPNSLGTVIPTVSGMFRVVAPALMTSPNISYRNSLSDLIDSKKPEDRYIVILSSW